MWGDFIYYPYSLNSTTNSFNTVGGGQSAAALGADVRFDNCTDAYGSVGGLRIGNMFRGMGLPNTEGSTSIVDDSTIPRTLNADCNLYLSYSVQTDSNLRLASNLPRKMTHGHLLVLSSLIEQPKFIMSKVGAVNGMSIINKSFITGDFILSTGQLTFFAERDMLVSQITTRIVNSNYEAPAVLGQNSTVIYEIVNNNPKPMDRPKQISEVQSLDYQLMAMLNTHLETTADGKTSDLTQLENDLYALGVNTVTEANPNIVGQLRQQIGGLGLMNMSPMERQQFFTTPAGQLFMQNASDMSNISNSLRHLEAAPR